MRTNKGDYRKESRKGTGLIAKAKGQPEQDDAFIPSIKKKDYFKHEKRGLFGEYVPGTDGDDFGLFVRAGKLLREELDVGNVSSQEEEESKKYNPDSSS